MAGHDLRSCPLCQRTLEGVNIGARDYRGVNALLPNRIGGTDVDLVLQQNGTDRMLVVEFKPSIAPLMKGQRDTLAWFARKGADVWVVCDTEYPTKVQLASLDGKGVLSDWRTMSAVRYHQLVADWWMAPRNKAS